MEHHPFLDMTCTIEYDGNTITKKISQRSDLPEILMFDHEYDRYVVYKDQSGKTITIQKETADYILRGMTTNWTNLTVIYSDGRSHDQNYICNKSEDVCLNKIG